MKKVKQALRFFDLDQAKDFINNNKIPYDEIMVLFDNYIEDEEAEKQEEKIPEKEIDRDKLIEELMKEVEDLKKGKTKEMPKPEKPIKLGFFKRPKTNQAVEI